MLSSSHSPGLDLVSLFQSMNDDLVSIERTINTLRQRLDGIAALTQTATVATEAVTLTGTTVPESACSDNPVDMCGVTKAVVVDHPGFAETFIAEPTDVKPGEAVDEWAPHGVLENEAQKTIIVNETASVDQPAIADALGSRRADVTSAEFVEGSAMEILVSKEPNDATVTDDTVAIVTISVASETSTEIAPVAVKSIETPECEPAPELYSVSVVAKAAAPYDETVVAPSIVELAAALSTTEDAESALGGVAEPVAEVLSGTADRKCAVGDTLVATAAYTAIAEVAAEHAEPPTTQDSADATTPPNSSEIICVLDTMIVDQATPAKVETSAVVVPSAIMRASSAANNGAASSRAFGLLAAACAVIILLGSAALT